jgi:aminobenzoyl-glutamate transport protein
MAAGGLLSCGIAALAIAPSSPLRNPLAEGEPAVEAIAPFLESVEILIAVLFAVPGIVYGVLTKKIRNDKDAAAMMTETMATMGAYLVLAFAAAQFVAFFNWTNLGAITAVKGARLLEAMNLTGFWLLLAFITVSACMNLVMGSASAKWAFMAPIFIPMLMVMGFSPEAVQAGYRVGDSITNIITPLMPYLPVIIIFAQRYDRRMGLGTLIAAMLPYSVAFAIFWVLLLGVWFGFDIPLGTGVSTTWAPGD